MKAFFVYASIISFLLFLVIFLKFYAKDSNISQIIKSVFTYLEIIILTIFFVINMHGILKKIVSFLCVLLISLNLYLTFYSNSNNNDFLPLSLECFYFIVIIIFYFFEKIRNVNQIPLFFAPGFWISVAFLLNFAGTIFVFLFSFYTPMDANFKETYRNIYGSITIIKNILLCMAVIVNAKQNRHVLNKKLPNLDINLDTFNPFNKKTNLRLL